MVDALHYPSEIKKALILMNQIRSQGRLSSTIINNLNEFFFFKMKPRMHFGEKIEKRKVFGGLAEISKRKQYADRFQQLTGHL